MPRGVHLVVTDDHDGLKKAVAEVSPTALWQRCYVDFRGNALDHLPRSADRTCLQGIRALALRTARRHQARAPTCAAGWKSAGKANNPKLCAWVEGHIEETFAFYRLPPSPPQAPQIH